MSVILLVKLAGFPDLYRANTQEKDAAGNPVVRFKAWIDRNGVDLYWRGRLVDMLYTMSLSTERWIDVSIPTAIERLEKKGACVRVSSEPSPEGRLPE